MKIALLGWKSKGLRCPDVDISLSDGSKVHKVSLIQMPNGTGKTTTLSMLRATLSGSARYWDESEILNYKSRDYDSEHGQFTVALEVDSKRITFELNLNFIDQKVSYQTSFGSGIEDGWSPPPYLRQFLDINFIKLFVFDGELANALTKNKETKAKEALEALFQLYLFQDINNCFEEYWLSYKDNVGATDDKALSRRQNRYNALKKKLEKLENEETILITKKDKLKTRVEELTKKYKLLLHIEEQNKGELDSVTEKLNLAINDVNKKLVEIVEISRDPHRILEVFCTELVELKLHLDDLQLPRSTSKQFFYELAAESNDECICGTKLTEEKRKRIIEKSEEYLAEDDTGILNSIKTEIGQISQNKSSYYIEETQDLIEKLNVAIRVRDGLDKEQKALEKAVLESGSTEIIEVKTMLDEKVSDFKQTADQLNEMERSPLPGDDDDSNCIQHIKNAKEEAADKLAEITKTVEIKGKYSLINSILTKAVAVSTNKIKALIVLETNEKMKALLPLELIQLSSIDNSLKLKGREGASVGQTLALAYGFLSTLFSRGNHELPFIVDSPSGPLDLTVRKQVASLIPKLSEQFVAFTISSERENFTEPLEAEAGSIQYLTLFRKSNSTSHLLATLPKEGVQEKANSLLVSSKQFFYNFDLEQEVL